MPTDEQVACLFDQAKALWSGLEEAFSGYIREHVNQRFGEPMGVHLMRIHRLPSDGELFRVTFLVEFSFRDPMAAEVIIQEQEVVEALTVS